MLINLSKEVPDSTYFTASDCEPTLKEEVLTIYDGKGRSRSWGCPSVTSTIVFESTDIIAVHIGFHHKHRGGQFWRYYQINGEVKQTEWKSLDDDTRLAILEGYEKNAPNWANVPGKLRKDYLPSNPKKNMFVAYKVMNVFEGKLTSLYDHSVIYELNKVKVQASKPDHEGGWYVHPLEGLKEKFISGNLYKSPFSGNYAIVKCECWGNKVSYDNGKYAVTYCKPVEIIEEFEL